MTKTEFLNLFPIGRTRWIAAKVYDALIAEGYAVVSQSQQKESEREENKP